MTVDSKVTRSLDAEVAQWRRSFTVAVTQKEKKTGSYRIATLYDITKWRFISKCFVLWLALQLLQAAKGTKEG